MATSVIAKGITDVIQVDGSQSQGVSISSNTSKDFAEYVVDITIPSGYKPILTWYTSVGNGRCLPTNFGDTWIANFSGSTQTIKIVKHSLCVKYA